MGFIQGPDVIPIFFRPVISSRLNLVSIATTNVCFARLQSCSHQRGVRSCASYQREKYPIEYSTRSRAHAPVEDNEECFSRKSEGQPLRIIHYIDSAGRYGVTIIGH
jgi:hypothetical protein